MRLLLVATLLILGACGGEDPLAGREFVVVDSDGIELAPGSALRVTFADGTLRVTGGCNVLSGGYSLRDERLIVGELVQTEMACDEPLMRLDADVAALVASSPSIARVADVLTIGDGSRSLTLRATQD